VNNLLYTPFLFPIKLN